MGNDTEIFLNSVRDSGIARESARNALEWAKKPAQMDHLRRTLRAQIESSPRIKTEWVNRLQGLLNSRDEDVILIAHTCGRSLISSEDSLVDRVRKLIDSGTLVRPEVILSLYHDLFENAKWREQNPDGVLKYALFHPAEARAGLSYFAGDDMGILETCASRLADVLGDRETLNCPEKAKLYIFYLSFLKDASPPIRAAAAATIKLAQMAATAQGVDTRIDIVPWALNTLKG